jgi:diaminohydroxyphosphoribosylaminopyrimidine deaminase / 5-amino-6-(5-phosphoribosylamino)uracil reductase
VAESARERDERFMARALRAAKSGDPSPNPHVGAVIARGSELISVGYHPRCGGPHAEVVALRRAGARARNATLYVTLEPCNHHGRTPPCTEAIIAAGIKRVVVGAADPLPHKRGAYARLRKHGIAVEHGVLGEHAERLIADFRKYRLHGLPYVTLKAAVTLDGRTAARSGESKWITGAPARAEAHRMRAQSDAVLVGVGTVLADDPELTVRAVRGRDPLRVVLDSQLRTPASAKLVSTASAVKTLILHAHGASVQRAAKLRARSVELLAVPKARRGGGLDPEAVLRALAERGVVRVLVEGGAHVHAALLEAGLVDAAAVFVAPRFLGDMQAIPMVAGAGARSLQDAFVLVQPEIVRLGDDVLFRGSVRCGQAQMSKDPAAAAKAGPRRSARL